MYNVNSHDIKLLSTCHDHGIQHGKAMEYMIRKQMWMSHDVDPLSLGKI